MKKELIAKELVKIAKELIAEQYSVSDITKKDWDRAWDLLHKPISAVTSMRKLTKQPKKLFARAACIYAIYNKIEQAEKIRDEYNKLFAKIHKRNNKMPYTLYQWRLDKYADELLKDMPYLIVRAEKIKLQDIPHGKSMCKQFDDFIKQTQEDIKNFSEYEEEYKSGKQQLRKRYQLFLKKLSDNSRDFGTLRKIEKEDGSYYWTKSDFYKDKPRRFDIDSIPENVKWQIIGSSLVNYGGKKLKEYLTDYRNSWKKESISVDKIPQKLYEQFLELYKEYYNY